MNETKYKIRVIRGAFVDPIELDNLEAVIIKKIDDPDWQSIDEIVITLDQVKELQKSMVKHSENDKAPWYLDGYEVDDKNKMLVAFGADDGEGGKIFIFDRSDKETINKVAEYGISKGIPAEQMGFGDIDF